MALEHETVTRLLPDLRGRTALDVGCGSGRYVQEMASRGARASGVDLSAAMLLRAREVTRRVARGDAATLPIRTMSIDAVVCGLVLADVADLAPALAEMSRVLRPGGVLVYSVVHPCGAAAGWSRSFDAGGRRLAIASHWHPAAQHRAACAASGLTIDAWEEPVLSEAPDHPALLVVRATR
jgi:malonyl-CoA O-methyltransferase